MTINQRPSLMKSRFRCIVSLTAACGVFALVVAAVFAQQATPSTKTDAEIIQGIDAAVYSRFNAISGYTVQEQYTLYRNADPTPAAEETIKTVYTRAVGKEYTPIAQSGSAFLRSAVIDRVLAGEKDLNLAANREGALITSKNYEFHPQPGVVDLNGRQCIVVTLKPLRKSPHLFNGKMWIDASDYTVVRLQGAPSQSPSIFAGQATVARDYIKVDGFSMATHAEARSHTFLFGETLLKIDYTNYQIQRDPSATVP
jgi:outer membrane lipoprotein-sorting protein